MTCEWWATTPQSVWFPDDRSLVVCDSSHAEDWPLMHRWAYARSWLLGCCLGSATLILAVGLTWRSTLPVWMSVGVTLLCVAAIAGTSVVWQLAKRRPGTVVTVPLQGSVLGHVTGQLDYMLMRVSQDEKTHEVLREKVLDLVRRHESGPYLEQTLLRLVSRYVDALEDSAADESRPASLS